MVCLSQESAKLKVRYLLVGYPARVRKNRCILVLKNFVDDSGSDPGRDGIFVLYGYLMEEPRWEDFAERWDAQLRRPEFFPIPYCRMSDAEEGSGPFAGMDKVFRQRKVKDLAEVIHECTPTGIGCKMTWERYNRIVKDRVDPRLDNPYAILFFMVMRSVTDLQIKMAEEISDADKEQVKKDYGIEIALKPVDFVFDDQGPAGLQCLRWWGDLKDRVHGPHAIVLANSPQFKDDRQLAPLQAADMLAWHIRRESEYPSEDRSEIINLINPSGTWEREISDDMLRQIVDAFNTKVDLSKL